MKGISRQHRILGASASLWVLLGAAAYGAPPWQTKVADCLLGDPQGQEHEFLVVLTEQADLDQAAHLPDKLAKGRHVFATLRQVAATSQPPVIAVIEQARASYRSYWIANLLWVRGDADLMQALARREDVARVVANPRVRLQDLTGDASGKARPTGSAEGDLRNVEWNVAHVNGPDVWAQGNRGQASVVGGTDTGYDWQHPALREQYRGWEGGSADHDYNWHDAIHSGGGDCGSDSPAPCDDHGHGTHTLGTMVGDDGAGNQIGLAPGARWIGCRCLDDGWGTPATFIECLEWMVAPYPIDGTPADGDPHRAPDVINNSWACIGALGCSWDTLLPTIQNVRAAGIVVVSAAGGDGPGCGTIEDPPGIYDESLTVSATDELDFIASFSGRGPVSVDGSGRIKPDVCAPGLPVRSSVPGGGYSYYSGTSMAAPLVAAEVALVVTASPGLKGDVEQIEQIITESALPLTSAQCGDGGGVPNNVYGYGRIDALAAVSRAVTSVSQDDRPGRSAVLSLEPGFPNPFNPCTTIVCELAAAAMVELRVYDGAGRLVRTLAAGEWLPAGRHLFGWQGRDETDRLVAAGVYFCRLDALGETRIQPMTLLK